MADYTEHPTELDLTKIKKQAYKSLKTLRKHISYCYEYYIYPHSDVMYPEIEILKDTLVSIEYFAVNEGVYTIDKILDFVDEGYEALSSIEHICDMPDDDKRCIGEYQQQDEVEDNVDEFIKIFNKLTRLKPKNKEK